MKNQLIYVELKTGYNDNGPAWIGRARFSKTGRTVYFNGKAFQSSKGQGLYANYYDVETGEDYWISGVKKNQWDRHWAGSGAVMIDREVVEEYLELVDQESLPASQYKIVELDKIDIRPRIHELQNQTAGQLEGKCRSDRPE